MNALLQCNIPQLHLPMVWLRPILIFFKPPLICTRVSCLNNQVTVVDYWGWRVFAEAALPINKYTIVYGSDNGGRHGSFMNFGSS